MLPPNLSLFLHLLAAVMSNPNTRLLFSWVLDIHLRELYIDYYYSITTSYPINFFLHLFTSSKTPWNITPTDTMGIVFPFSYYGMDKVLISSFPLSIINNNIHFLTYIPESVIYFTGVRWYVSPFPIFYLPIKVMMMYDPISPYYSRPDAKIFYFHGGPKTRSRALSMNWTHQLLRPLISWCIIVYFTLLELDPIIITHSAPPRELVCWGINFFQLPVPLLSDILDKTFQTIITWSGIKINSLPEFLF